MSKRHRGFGEDRDGEFVRDGNRWRCDRAECAGPRDSYCEHEIADGWKIYDALNAPVEYVSDPAFEKMFGLSPVEDDGPVIGHGEE
jgi:hypothetical protein